MSSKKYEASKRISYYAAILIVTLNIIAWICLLWSESEFIYSATYIKIVITSIALIILSLLIAGFAGFMYEEEKLKKDKLIN